MKLKKFIKKHNKEELGVFIKHQKQERDILIERVEELEKEQDANVRFIRKILGWE